MAGLRAPELAQVSGSDLPTVRDTVERNSRKTFDFLRVMLSQCPFLDGRLIEGVALAAGATTQVAHGLGRAYRGWWVASGSINADYPGEGTSDDATNFLALTVTNAQTVDLWVF